MAGKTPIKLTVSGRTSSRAQTWWDPVWGVFFQVTPVVKVAWQEARKDEGRRDLQEHAGRPEVMVSGLLGLAPVLLALHHGLVDIDWKEVRVTLEVLGVDGATTFEQRVGFDELTTSGDVK